MLDYKGNTRIAEMFGNVRLVDANRSTLYTDHLIYDRNTEIAFYDSGGRIVDEENELVSRIGYYYSNDEEFFFKEDVVVTTPDYNMYSDTLMYNTETEITHIFGPTKIIGEEDSVYCEKGWYDTKNDIANLKKNAFVMHKEHLIYGDTLYYEKENDYGRAYNNITIKDTLQDVIGKGNRALYIKDSSFAYLTDSAMTIIIDKEDSLFMHADTIKVLFDTNSKARTIQAFYKVKYYRHDIQGMCDSLIYDVNDSTIIMYKNPVLWSEDNQLTADSIKIAISNEAIDTMALYNTSFIISRDDSGTFNQIKGKTMSGYFKDNVLFKIIVSGNSETIYFVRDEYGRLIGINKAESSDMLIFLKDKQMKTITYIKKPTATLYPKEDLGPQDLRLRDFRWFGKHRPQKKEEIFMWIDTIEDTSEK